MWEMGWYNRRPAKVSDHAPEHHPKVRIRYDDTGEIETVGDYKELEYV